jgi:putative hemolysin
MDSRTTPSTLAGTLGAAIPRAGCDVHIIDQMLAERTTTLSQHRLWPVLRPLLLRVLHYREAIRLADAVANLSGWDAMCYLSNLLELDVAVSGRENLPASGGFILAPTHPTGIADGVAVFDMLKTIRRDIAIFANRDAQRVAPGFREIIIPVEWRQGEKSHAKSRETLELTARAFAAGKAIVLFPSGRIAFWHEGALTERPWQPSVVSLARRYRYPVVPARITARNSGLFYLLSKYSTDLRDMTIFHELLNKKARAFTIEVGRPISSDALDGEPTEVAQNLQQHTVRDLAADLDARFVGSASQDR